MLILIFFTLDTDDKELVDVLFTQQHLKMFNISYKILGSEQDAEDALGDAFVNIIENLKKIKDLPCHERVPYCVVIVRNSCFTILRRRKKVVPTEQAEWTPDDGLTVEEDYFKADDAAGLALFMKKLSATDRQLLRLRHEREMSYREIGALLGIAEATARKREQRALIRLREMYAREREE